MSSALAIAASGLQTAQLRLTSSAHNVANLNTPGFHRQEVVQHTQTPLGGVQASVQRAPSEGVSLEQEVVDQMSASYTFKANLLVLRSSKDLLGSLLDTYA